MISAGQFCTVLNENGVDFFCGVPDSLLKELCTFIDANIPVGKHVITANEGNAVGLATGYYLGTNKAAVVYMQNSGLGNAVNPLTSLADPQVYSVPMLLIIGWRGEPGVKDEPQHVKQGAITQAQLEIMDIPYVIVDGECDYQALVTPLLQRMNNEQRPVAILVRKNSFEKEPSSESNKVLPPMKREQVLETLLASFDDQDLIVSTTGKTSREVFEIRRRGNQTCADFLTVGAMGHTSSIGMGLALARTDKRVIVIDGDGAMLMHMGAMPVLASRELSNLLHIVLNNACHESVGGQPTVADQVDVKGLAYACGYKTVLRAENTQQLSDCLGSLNTADGPICLEIVIAPGSRSDLGRPDSTPVENKQAFMHKAGSA